LPQWTWLFAGSTIALRLAKTGCPAFGEIAAKMKIRE
jgi:hypothetical protein